MKERVLRLCKRLNNFSLDELIVISELDSEFLNSILNELVDEGFLNRVGTKYLYNRIEKTKHTISMQTPFFDYYTNEVIDLIIRSFCSKLPIEIVENIVQVSENSLIKFYSFFRDKLYLEQLKELNDFYSKNPKMPRHQTYFNKPISFYIYGKTVYVTEKEFSKQNEIVHSKSEIKEFKKVYSYLKRLESHNMNNKNLHRKIAESLWRRGKTFDEMYFSLKKIANL